MTARASLVWTCLWTAHLASSALQGWNQSVDVIKIQRDGSQVRTVYLPRHVPSRSDPTHPSTDSLVLVSQSQSERGGTHTSRPKSKTVVFTPETNLTRKPFTHPVIGNNSSVPLVKHVIRKKRKHHLKEVEPPFLGLSFRAPGVEIKTGADKIPKCKYCYCIFQNI